MSPQPQHVIIGPLTQRLLDSSTWKPHNQFPAHQAWADEFECALEFLREEDVLDSFVHRLKLGERGVWAEVWAAFYFSKNRFIVSQWEPEYVPNHPGDLEITLGGGLPVFVEVKRPGWQGELTSKERADGRADNPKYRNAEVRSFDNVGLIVNSIRKALPKFSSGCANIVVVVDDLFLSPLDEPGTIFRDRIIALLMEHEFSIVSGVLLLKPVLCSECVEYRALFLSGCGEKLPPQVLHLFTQANKDSG